MLSVIVYGRNDSHGYNLHKRATLSLNAIAHVLDDPDDEIIFVDYNTPDEIPTFPEVIADTLTQAAKDRLRIIRVRPAYHAQFNGKTRLAALEPQSRNIAIRRANPANRWVLSTNTDMIFVPSERDGSLSGVCADFADAFYHLPRFELPEGFWERADRADPVAIIETMRRLGRRYHLNEIVYGGYDNIYEGPGDFQLFLRDDLFRIGGFDERMLLGWHADTNMARRMRLLRGNVDTAFPALSGYHCGHTRQATSLHGSGRTENSIATFVRDVQDARWTPDDDWGAPDQTFEEFRLSDDRHSVFLSAIDRAVPESGPDMLEATFNEGTYGKQGYEPMHVLPHLADVLFNLAAGQSIFVVGSDEVLLGGLARFLTAPPLAMRLTLCSESNSPGPDGLSGDHAFAPLDVGLAEANVVLLQYPNASTVDKKARADLQWYVQFALEKFIELERTKPTHKRRRIVIVNGTHNPLQDIIHGSIDVATMPYSSRIRHGRVADPGASLYPSVGLPSSLDGAFYAQLGRARGYSDVDLAQIRRAIAQEPGWERMAIELSALGEHANWATGLTGADASALKQLGENAATRISAVKSATPLAASIQTPRTGAANRLCSSADWEDPAWRALAERYFGQRIYALGERSRWVWERITLLHELTRRLTPSARPWVLVVANGPDALPALLSHLGYHVAYESIDPENVATAAEWESAFRIGGLVLPASLLPLSEAPEGIEFGALLAPGAALFRRGQDHFESTLARFARHMTKDAHFGASTLVHLNDGEGGGALSHTEFAGAFNRTGWLGANRLHGDESIDARIPLETLVKYADSDSAKGGVPGLSFGFDPSVQVTVGALWARFGKVGLLPSTSKEPLAPPPDEMVAFAAAMRSKTVVHANLFTHTARNLIPFVLCAEESGAFPLAVPVTRLEGGFEVELELSGAASDAIHSFLLTEDDAVLVGSTLSSDRLVRIVFPAAPESLRGMLVVFADRALPTVRSIRGRACSVEAAETVA